MTSDTPKHLQALQSKSVVSVLVGTLCLLLGTQPFRIWMSVAGYFLLGLGLGMGSRFVYRLFQYHRTQINETNPHRWLDFLERVRQYVADEDPEQEPTRTAGVRVSVR
jgi:hypothetical protein